MTLQGIKLMKAALMLQAIGDFMQRMDDEPSFSHLDLAAMSFIREVEKLLPPDAPRLARRDYEGIPQ